MLAIIRFLLKGWNAMRIITISREFGSGGRELGKRLADALGFAYYDKEIITDVAEKTSLDENYIEKSMERGIVHYFPTMTFAHAFNDYGDFSSSTANLFGVQCEVVKELATKGDCVIVGRNGDVLLEEYNPLRIFVYANMESKVERCKNRAAENEKSLSDKDYVKKIKQIDKSRAQNHSFISSTSWGNIHGYDLCINTSNLDIKSIIPQIAAFAEYWFSTHNEAEK